MIKLILLLNPVYVTLFWTIVLSLNPVKSNIPKWLLSKFMAATCLIFVSHLFYFLPLPETYLYFDALYQFLTLLVYPLYYIYIRLITIDNDFSLKKHIRFLILPAFFSLAYFLSTITMSKEEHLYFVFSILPLGIPAKGIFLYAKSIYILCRILFVIQTATYLALSYKLISVHKEQVQNYYSNTDEDSLRKVYLLNITLILTVIFGITFAFIGKKLFAQSTNMLIAPSLLFSTMLFAIGWLGNKQRSVLIDVFEREAMPVSLSSDELCINPQIKQAIIDLFEKEKIYLNKNLTLWDISRMTGSNRTYISNVINKEFGLNFSTFVNNHRVDHAKMLLSQDKTIKNENLADLSGFGSEDSLQRSFKSKENTSLRKFRNG